MSHFDFDRLFEHKHIISASSTGKAALDLEPLVLRLCDTDSLIILDCKGDPAFVQSVRRAAGLTGRTFKQFSIGNSSE